MIKLKVTVAVVCLNEEKNIADLLSSLFLQSYGLKNFEILAVDNNSLDKTCQIIKNFQKKHKNLKLIVNPIRGIASSRNVAVRNAQSKLLAFTDADCVAPKDWLENLVLGFQLAKKKDAKVIGVGGANIPPGKTKFSQALGIFLDSFLGTGRSVQGRVYSQNRYVPHFPCVNVLYEREKIKEVGGFDESFGSIIEDEDLSWRLSKEGYRFFYLANASIIHKWVDNYLKWVKKMFVWGKGRIWFLKKHPERFQLIFLGPVGLAFLLLFSPFHPPLLILILLYLLLIFFYSLWGSLQHRHPSLVSYLFPLYFLSHLFYGLGEIYGIFKKR